MAKVDEIDYHEAGWKLGLESALNEHALRNTTEMMVEKEQLTFDLSTWSVLLKNCNTLWNPEERIDVCCVISIQMKDTLMIFSPWR